MHQKSLNILNLGVVFITPLLHQHFHRKCWAHNLSRPYVINDRCQTVWHELILFFEMMAVKCSLPYFVKMSHLSREQSLQLASFHSRQVREKRGRDHVSKKTGNEPTLQVTQDKLSEDHAFHISTSVLCSDIPWLARSQYILLSVYIIIFLILRYLYSFYSLAAVLFFYLAVIHTRQSNDLIGFTRETWTDDCGCICCVCVVGFVLVYKTPWSMPGISCWLGVPYIVSVMQYYTSDQRLYHILTQPIGLTCPCVVQPSLWGRLYVARLQVLKDKLSRVMVTEMWWEFNCGR